MLHFNEVKMTQANTIGPYELLRVLDAGGMGRVYLARKRTGVTAGRQVVVKTIRAELEHTSDHMHAFQREAELLAHLRHPNIVKLYDAGQDGRKLYIVMEYLQGFDLAKILDLLATRGQRVPVSAVLAIGIHVARALQSAHSYSLDDGKQAGLVHRDLSPHNIFVLHTGDVKILDFGLARAYGSPGNTRTGMVKGKFRYLAPEQARAEELDARVDIFALGLVLHELLLGQRAYNHAGELDVLRAAMAGKFKRLSELDPTLPGPLVRVIERAVRADRNERYPSAGVFAEDLTQAAVELRITVDNTSLRALLRDVEQLAPQNPVPIDTDGDDPDATFSSYLSDKKSASDSDDSSLRLLAPPLLAPPWRTVWFIAGGISAGAFLVWVLSLVFSRSPPSSVASNNLAVSSVGIHAPNENVPAAPSASTIAADASVVVPTTSAVPAAPPAVSASTEMVSPVLPAHPVSESRPYRPRKRERSARP